MTSKLSQLATAAGRTWSVNQVVTAAQMNSDVAGTAAFVQGGAGNRPFLWAQNTSGIASVTNAGVDVTFDTATDYDTGWNGSTTYTVGTAGWYNINLSSFPMGYQNGDFYTLKLVTKVSGTTTTAAVQTWSHSAFAGTSTPTYILFPCYSICQYFNVGDTIKFVIAAGSTNSSIPSAATAGTGYVRPTLSIQWVSA